MTILELVTKWSFVDRGNHIYTLNLDDCENIELYQTSLKFAFVRHGCDGYATRFHTYATEIDKYLDGIINRVYDE